MANPGDTPRIDDIESSLPVKYQYKQVQALTQTTGILSDLTFSNLTVGKTYRIVFGLVWQSLSAGAGTIGVVHIEYGSGTDIKRIVSNQADSDGIREGHSTVEYIFTAAESTLQFNASSGWDTNYRILGDPSDSGTATYAQLEELPNHTVTTDWT